MKSFVKYSVAAFLAVYSITLLVTQALTSEKFVRPYFDDIVGKVAFYGVNTSLSAFFLVATALTFFLSLSLIKDNNKDEKIFYMSQIVIFLYLAIDDRFQIHDSEWVMSIPFLGNLLFPIVGVVNLYFLWKYGKILEKDRRILKPLLIASILFAIMFTIDVFGPKVNMYLRLSLEDLSKTWANVFFFLFAYNIFQSKVALLQNKEKEEVNYA
jgi:hypothetical protein